MARPRRPPPPPLETNDVRVAAAGAAIWCIALVVLLLIGLPESDTWWLWVCVTGIAIGLFGMLYIPRLQRSRTALIASHTNASAQARPTPDPEEATASAPRKNASAEDKGAQNAGEPDPPPPSVGGHTT